jgi:hypothetical protein
MVPSGLDGERQLLRTGFRQGAGRHSQERLVSGRVARERQLLHALRAICKRSARAGGKGATFRHAIFWVPRCALARVAHHESVPRLAALRASLRKQPSQEDGPSVSIAQRGSACLLNPLNRRSARSTSMDVADASPSSDACAGRVRRSVPDAYFYTALRTAIMQTSSVHIGSVG